MKLETQNSKPETAAARRAWQKLMSQKKHSRDNAFTACTLRISLLETVTDAAEIAAKLAEILRSTARSSFDEFQNARKCGQKLYKAVESISWGREVVNPNINGQGTANLGQTTMIAGNFNFSFRAFLREKHGANHSLTKSSLEKGRQERQAHE